MSGLLGALFGRLRKRDLEEEPAELQQTADEALERVAGDATGRSQIELLQRTVDEMARKLEERNKRSNRMRTSPTSSIACWVSASLTPSMP